MSEENQRVWIELEVPVVRRTGQVALDKQKAAMIARAKLASNMLRRLGIEGPDRFGVTEEKGGFYYTVQDNSGLYTVLNDNGHWFNLDYLGRED